MSVRAPDDLASKRSILVVDDYEPMRSAIYGVLSPRYRVTLAVDGVDGVDKSRDLPAPDLIIADVVMPRLDGIAMVRRIRESDAMRQVRVILISGQMSVQSVLAGLAVVPFGYLAKPINPVTFLKKVRSALGEL
jgi:two-component system chemotaxis response regulator CheY